MKQRNFIIEAYEVPNPTNPEMGNRRFIIRELPKQPNSPAQTVAVCDSVSDLATFFDEDALFNEN